MPAARASSPTIWCSSGASSAPSGRAPLLRSTSRSEKNQLPTFMATPMMANSQA